MGNVEGKAARTAEMFQVNSELSRYGDNDPGKLTWSFIDAYDNIGQRLSDMNIHPAMEDLGYSTAHSTGGVLPSNDPTQDVEKYSQMKRRGIGGAAPPPDVNIEDEPHAKYDREAIRPTWRDKIELLLPSSENYSEKVENTSPSHAHGSASSRETNPRSSPKIMRHRVSGPAPPPLFPVADAHNDPDLQLSNKTSHSEIYGTEDVDNSVTSSTDEMDLKNGPAPPPPGSKYTPRPEGHYNETAPSTSKINVTRPIRRPDSPPPQPPSSTALNETKDAKPSPRLDTRKKPQGTGGPAPHPSGAKYLAEAYVKPSEIKPKRRGHGGPAPPPPSVACYARNQHDYGITQPGVFNQRMTSGRGGPAPPTTPASKRFEEPLRRSYVRNVPRGRKSSAESQPRIGGPAPPPPGAMSHTMPRVTSGQVKPALGDDYVVDVRYANEGPTGNHFRSEELSAPPPPVPYLPDISSSSSLSTEDTDVYSHTLEWERPQATSGYSPNSSTNCGYQPPHNHAEETIREHTDLFTSESTCVDRSRDTTADLREVHEVQPDSRTQQNNGDLFDDLRAAFAKRRKRIDGIGDDENSDDKRNPDVE